MYDPCELETWWRNFSVVCGSAAAIMLAITVMALQSRARYRDRYWHARDILRSRAPRKDPCDRPPTNFG